MKNFKVILILSILSISLIGCRNKNKWQNDTSYGEIENAPKEEISSSQKIVIQDQSLESVIPLDELEQLLNEYNISLEEFMSDPESVDPKAFEEIFEKLEEYQDSPNKESKPFGNFLDRAINDYNETIGKIGSDDLNNGLIRN